MKQSDRWVAIGVSMRKATRSRLPPYATVPPQLEPAPAVQP